MMRFPTSLRLALSLLLCNTVVTHATAMPQMSRNLGLTADPPSRALSKELCREPRLAGTRGSARAAEWVAKQLTQAGWDATIEVRSVLLSLPIRTEVESPGLFHRRARFDPDAIPSGDVPPVLVWAKSGTASGEVISVGRGSRSDFEALLAAGVQLKGKIALASYGGAYRGVKVALAAEFGCAAALLFSPSEEDGPAKGPTWPRGPWKPASDAQRGSILSLTEAPGDPSTPGWPSPLIAGEPGSDEAKAQEPLSGAALEARLPQIPALPLGSADAAQLLQELEAGRFPRVTLQLEMRVQRRPMHNVIARLTPTTGPGGDFVMAGTHRDAWVRGAQDSGSGVVALLRAAQHLGARYQAGWRPKNELRLGFWDAEETGLFGSTEWAEAHASELREHCIAYINGDAAVSGLDLRADGTPGLLGILKEVLGALPALRPAQTEVGHEPTLLEQWTNSHGDAPRLGLPGSGSDYTVFLHHLGLPILNLGFVGNTGGQYHTRVDDFALMDRSLDPDWRAHETAGELFSALLELIAERGRESFDAEEASTELLRVFTALQESHTELDLEPLIGSLQELDRIARGGGISSNLYALLALPNGLPGRPWYQNPLWAPGTETGYAAILLPTVFTSANPAREVQRLAEHLDKQLSLMPIASPKLSLD